MKPESAGSLATCTRPNEPRKFKGIGMMNKTVVQGMIGLGVEDRCQVVSSNHTTTLDPNVRRNVEDTSTVHTVALQSYRKLRDEYIYYTIDHAVSYVEGRVYTNSIENIWSLLERGLNGTHIAVGVWHLQAYRDEQAFRFNERKASHYTRFCSVMRRVIDRPSH